MPDQPTTYLSHPTPAPPATPGRRVTPAVAGVLGLLIGALLGAGGVWVSHTGSGSSTNGAPTGQMGNFPGGQQGGAPGGVAPSGAPQGGGAPQ